MKLPTCREKKIVKAWLFDPFAPFHSQCKKAMKLLFVCMTLAILQASATGFAQDVTLNLRNAPVEKVLKEIETQTGYGFIYSRRIVDKVPPITIRLEDVPVREALEICFKDYSLDFVIRDMTIIITPKKEVIPVQDVAVNVFGKVSSEQGEPLAGVSIVVVGSTKGTSSNAAGQYSLENVDENASLRFSMVGYVAKAVAVKGRREINVSLSLEMKEQDEVVVVGYGTMKRKDLTGSVASIPMEEIKNTPFVSIDQALAGKAAGLQVIQADGSPGGVAKIRIRGGTSLLGGNDPLYIIDGIPVQIENRYLESAAEIVSPVDRFGSDNPNNTISGSFTRGLNSLAGLNINDIESIDILKDASATAIYGSKAANGVVIITTKKGKTDQKPILEFNYYTGISEPIKEELLNAEQYKAIFREGAKNLNDARAAIGEDPDPRANSILNDPEFLGTANTDWLDLVLQTGVSHNADVSVRGGGTNSRYYTSLAYTSQKGVIIGTDFERLAGKINMDNEITKKLSILVNLDYGFTKNNITNGMYTGALYMPPTLQAYNPDGSIHVINSADIGSADYEGFQNPLLLKNGVNKSATLTLLGSLGAQYEILPDLQFKSLVSANYSNYHQDNYVPSTSRIAASNGTQTTPGIATQSQSQNVNMFFENTLTWDKKFNENNRINVLLGTSWQKSKMNAFTASGQGFPDDKYLNNLSSAALALPPTGTAGQSSLLSFYARANYTLMERYLFTFTGRSDASSKFPSNNRVGYFPSGGIGWIVSEESFMKGLPWINYLKLRASAGYTGTQNIGDNLFYSLYGPGSYAGTNALVPIQLGNPDLKWESTLQKDVGIDLSLFDSRLKLSLGLYEKTTDGVLYTTTVAPSSGFGSLVSNIAKISNKGFEINVVGDIVENKNFQWTSSFNISQNRSKVLEISNDLAVQETGVVSFGNTALKVGEPLGLLYGRKFVGILQNQKEVDEYKAANLLASYGFFPYLGIGDPYYLLDDMGFLKDTIVGNAEPDFYGGFTNSFRYKNFSLIALLTFSYGGDINYLRDAQNHELRNLTNKSTRILDHWTPQNTGSEFPRLLLGESSYAYNSSMNIYDASFLKLKSITLNYDFSRRVLDKFKLRNASVYVSASNLFTITNYPGPDPEVTNDPYSIIGGYTDVAGYPTVKQYNAGIRIGF